MEGNDNKENKKGFGGPFWATLAVIVIFAIFCLPDFLEVGFDTLAEHPRVIVEILFIGAISFVGFVIYLCYDK